MKQDFTLYKLIILEMLNFVNFPLTNSQLTEFLIKYRYATYFEVQETISQLTASGLISEETVHHSTLYQMTGEGSRTLDYYRHMLPKSFIENIKDYLTKNKIELRSKVTVHSGYLPASNGEYAVQCRILEKGHVIFDMTLYAPTVELAEQMCYNWEKKQSALYSQLLMELTQNSSAEQSDKDNHAD